MTEATEQVLAQCAEWGISIDSSQMSRLSSYADLLAGYTVANVIGTRDRETIMVEHLLDSLSCLLAKPCVQSQHVVDVGTGGGLPGIPLAIARPELSVTLLEATQKKARFLDYVREQLGLTNIRVVNARAEEAGHEHEHRESFDLATARALATLPVVIEYCAPLVGAGGGIIAMKGRLKQDEISAGASAATTLGAELVEMQEIKRLPELTPKERRLIHFRKIRATPDHFPRRVGLASKRPLTA